MPDIVTNMMNSITGILTVVSTILETEGKPGWHKKVNKQTGETLTEADEQTLQPLVNFIVALPAKKNFVAMTGGGIDINSPFYALIQKMKELDASFDTSAFLRRMEATSDSMQDNKPLKALKYLSIPFPATKPVVDYIGEIPVPFRLLIAMGHSLLDILRLMVSLPGADMPLLRQMFSVALASLEFFRGQWKQSLLSAAGVISQSAMYAGFVGKVLMNIFSLISPSIQEDMILGSYSVTKSLIIGILIKIFQITATYETRQEAMKVFRELAEKNQIIDSALEEGGLVGQPADRSPDMSHPNRIQAALQDPTMTCSKEFQGTIQMAKQNIILKLIFQMLNMPVSEEDLLHHCKRFQNYMKANGYLSYKDLLVIEAGITEEMYKMGESSVEGKESEKKPEPAANKVPNERVVATNKRPIIEPIKPNKVPTIKPVKPNKVPSNKPAAANTSPITKPAEANNNNKTVSPITKPTEANNNKTVSNTSSNEVAEANEPSTEVEKNTSSNEPTEANEPSSEAAANEPSSEAEANEPSSEAEANEPSSEAEANEPSSEAEANEPSSDAEANEPSSEAAANEPSSEAAANEPSSEAEANTSSNEVAEANKPANNGTTANTPANNGTSTNTPANNGTTANTPANNGTTANTPANNGTTANTPANSGTTANTSANNEATAAKKQANNEEAKKQANAKKLEFTKKLQRLRTNVSVRRTRGDKRRPLSKNETNRLSTLKSQYSNLSENANIQKIIREIETGQKTD